MKLHKPEYDLWISTAEDINSVIFFIVEEFDEESVVRSCCRYELASCKAHNKKFFRTRAEYVKVFHVVPCFGWKDQAYIARRLDLSHYTVSGNKAKEYFGMLGSFLSEPANGHIEIVYYGKEGLNDGDFLKVINNPSETEEYRDLAGLFYEIDDSVFDEYMKVDPERKNKSVDAGFNGSLNYERRAELLGIPSPGRTRLQNIATKKAQERDFKLKAELDKSFIAVTKLAMLLSKQDNIWQDPPSRSALFANTLVEGNLTETLRICEVNGSCLELDNHWDDLNCRLASNSYVVNFTQYRQDANGNTVRRSKLGYSRKAITDHLIGGRKFGQFLKDLNEFVSDHRDRLEVKYSQFNYIYGKGKEGEDRIRILPSFDKLVYLSPYIDRLYEMQNQFALSAHQLLGALYSVVQRNRPDEYWDAVTEWLSDETKKDEICSLSGEDLCWRLYCHLEDVHENRREAFCQNSYRHQPCHPVEKDTKAKELKVRASYRSLLKIYYASKSLNRSMQGDSHYFTLAVSILSSTAFEDGRFTEGGVWGAGDLLSQHLLVVGSVLGLFPREWAFQAQIAPSTGTCVYLSEHYNLFENTDKSSEGRKYVFDPELAQEILRTVAFLLHSTLAVAENVICKFVQFRRLTSYRWRDSYYRGQRVFYSNRQHGEQYLMCMTADGSHYELSAIDPTPGNDTGSFRYDKYHDLGYWKRVPKFSQIGYCKRRRGISQKMPRQLKAHSYPAIELMQYGKRITVDFASYVARFVLEGSGNSIQKSSLLAACIDKEVEDSTRCEWEKVLQKKLRRKNQLWCVSLLITKHNKKGWYPDLSISGVYLADAEEPFLDISGRRYFYSKAAAVRFIIFQAVFFFRSEHAITFVNILRDYARGKEEPCLEAENPFVLICRRGDCSRISNKHCADSKKHFATIGSKRPHCMITRSFAKEAAAEDSTSLARPFAYVEWKSRTNSVITLVKEDCSPRTPALSIYL